MIQTTTGLCMIIGDTTQAAGPYDSRELHIGACNSVELERRQWTIVQSDGTQLQECLITTAEPSQSFKPSGSFLIQHEGEIGSQGNLFGQYTLENGDRLGR